MFSWLNITIQVKKPERTCEILDEENGYSEKDFVNIIVCRRYPIVLSIEFARKDKCDVCGCDFSKGRNRPPVLVINYLPLNEALRNMYKIPVKEGRNRECDMYAFDELCSFNCVGIKTLSKVLDFMEVFKPCVQKQTQINERKRIRNLLKQTRRALLKKNPSALVLLRKEFEQVAM